MRYWVVNTFFRCRFNGLNIIWWTGYIVYKNFDVFNYGHVGIQDKNIIYFWPKTTAKGNYITNICQIWKLNPGLSYINKLFSVWHVCILKCHWVYLYYVGLLKIAVIIKYLTGALNKGVQNI